MQVGAVCTVRMLKQAVGSIFVKAGWQQRVRYYLEPPSAVPSRHANTRELLENKIVTRRIDRVVELFVKFSPLKAPFSQLN